MNELFCCARLIWRLFMCHLEQSFLAVHTFGMVHKCSLYRALYDGVHVFCCFVFNKTINYTHTLFCFHLANENNFSLA